MKYSFLLAHRLFLQQQARLSHLAYAYERLSDFSARIARARLGGPVHLQQPEPEEERYQASLTALRGSQSAIEEHFTDRDLLDFVDAVGVATGDSEVDLQFELSEVEKRFLLPLRARLESAGVLMDASEADMETSTPEGFDPSQWEDGED